MPPDDDATDIFAGVRLSLQAAGALAAYLSPAECSEAHAEEALTKLSDVELRQVECAAGALILHASRIRAARAEATDGT